MSLCKAAATVPNHGRSAASRSSPDRRPGVKNRLASREGGFNVPGFTDEILKRLSSPYDLVED